MVLSARQFIIRLALALAVTLALSVAFQSWAHTQQRTRDDQFHDPGRTHVSAAFARTGRRI